MEKVILLTGASSGFGYASAELLARQGHKVYGAARRVEQMEPLAAVGVKTLRLDVTSNESIEAAVAEIIRAEGRIDVLVNNAATVRTARWKMCPSTKRAGSLKSTSSGWRAWCSVSCPTCAAGKAAQS